jgi:hypothetical protein
MAKNTNAKTEKPKEQKPVASKILKTIMLEEPNIKFDDLVAQMKEQGLTLSESTVASYYSDMKQTIAVMNFMGFKR